jgi:hypothetical protein
LLGGDAVGVPGRIGQARHQLGAHAVDGVGIEARLAERQRQQRHRLVAVLRQRLEAAVEGVAGVVEAHAHGDRLHALLELLGASSPAPSSSMPPRKCATPSLPSGAWTLPPLEGEAHGDQWDGVLLDEPGRYAAGAFDNLDFHGLGPADWE